MKKTALLSAFFSLALCHAASAQTVTTIPKQDFSQEFHDRLPENIRKAGKLITVNNGSFPPYEIIEAGNTMSGASADLAKALSELWGIPIEHATVAGLSSTLSGIKAGRYHMAMGPVGDFKSRQESNDFVDWVQEYVIFAVQKGNPKNINSIDDICGKKIAVQSAGSAERVVKAQSEKCVAEGKAAADVHSFADQPSSILSVRSKRTDAFFSSQAPLTYFVEQAKGDLELAGIGKSNGFGDLFQGSVVPKGSELGLLMKDSIQLLMDNGTYQMIMKKWGLENNMVSEVAVNKAKN